MITCDVCNAKIKVVELRQLRQLLRLTAPVDELPDLDLCPECTNRVELGAVETARATVARIRKENPGIEKMPGDLLVIYNYARSMVNGIGECPADLSVHEALNELDKQWKTSPKC